jgi:hypothetical protein
MKSFNSFGRTIPQGNASDTIVKGSDIIFGFMGIDI